MNEQDHVGQLIFTSSPTGLRGTPGWQVRAASRDLTNTQSPRYQFINPYLTYQLPEGMSTSGLTADGAPVDLTLADDGKERILLQKVYAGLDHAKRPGNFFIHVLAGLPKNFTAREAISLWRSPIWRKSTEGWLGPNQIEIEPSLHISDVLQPSMRRGAGPGVQGNGYNEAVDKRREELEFLIQAYLTLPKDGHIYVAAPPDVVATFIRDLTECVPAGLLGRLTFSTYTHDLANAHEMLVGTTWNIPPATYGSTAQGLPRHDLPQSYYEGGKNVALNWYTGKRSPLPGADGRANPQVKNYAIYAARCITGTADNKLWLDQIVDDAEQMGVKGVEDLLLVYRVHTAGADALSTQEMGNVLRLPLMAATLLPSQTMQAALINMALEERTWFDREAKPAILDLRTHHLLRSQLPPGALSKLDKALTQLADQATLMAVEYIKDDNTSAATLLVDGIAVNALDPHNSRPWLELFTQLGTGGQSHNQSQQSGQFQPHSRYSWEVRAWLLQRWQYVTEIAKNLQPWLAVPSYELSKLLKLPLQWKLHKEAVAIAMQADYNNQTASSAILGLIQVDMELVSEVLADIAIDEKRWQIAMYFFTKLMQVGKDKERLVLLEKMLNVVRNAPTPIKSQDLLHEANLRPGEITALLEDPSNKLLEGFRGMPVIGEITRQYMKAFSVASLEREETVRALDRLYENLRPEGEDADVVNRWRPIAKFLHSQELDLSDQGISSLAGVLTRLSAYSNPELQRIVVKRLVTHTFTRQQLDQVLRVLGKPLANSPWALYAQMAKLIAERNAVRTTRPALIAPYLEYGLKWDPNEVGKAAHSTLFKSLQKETLEAVDKQALDWEEPARSRWFSLRGKPIPHSPNKRSNRFFSLLADNLVFYPMLVLMGLTLAVLLFLNIVKLSNAASNSATSGGTALPAETRIAEASPEVGPNPTTVSEGVSTATITSIETIAPPATIKAVVASEPTATISPTVSPAIQPTEPPQSAEPTATTSPTISPTILPTILPTDTPQPQLTPTQNATDGNNSPMRVERASTGEVVAPPGYRLYRVLSGDYPSTIAQRAQRRSGELLVIDQGDDGNEIWITIDELEKSPDNRKHGFNNGAVIINVDEPVAIPEK